MTTANASPWGPDKVPTMAEVMDLVGRFSDQHRQDEGVQDALNALKEAVEKIDKKNPPALDSQED